ncbi:MAG TPA: 2-oxoglutarate and iron-dependent oxygenase domain-containing protein [Alphaproteobacteria bacterium]|nr:2-oxoglutarate and iron-dependent oxygenase domain-containing protein [Alphaproteobacteria bacterium]
MANASNLAAVELPRERLPVIDVSGLQAGQSAVRQRVAAQMRAACLDKGFFYVTGHGVAPTLIDAAVAEAKRFFALPLDSKMALRLENSWKRANRGYSPLRGQVLEKGTPADLKESFYIGIELPLDDPRVAAGKQNHGPNQWPDLPGFSQTLMAYFGEMMRVEHLLLRGLALSLDLDEHYFDAYYRDATATLRLLHYPPQPAAALPDEKGCGAHTDFGGITLLYQDDAGGLQVWDQDYGWVHMPPIPGTFVANLGDLIARWTNDRYRSTLHRVVNLSGRARYSLPFFFPGNPDYRIECLPTCKVPGVADRYAPVTVAEHLIERIRQSYG